MEGDVICTLFAFAFFSEERNLVGRSSDTRGHVTTFTRVAAHSPLHAGCKPEVKIPYILRPRE